MSNCQAYMHWIDEHGEEALLPGVNYTQAQLFFLNFAQVCHFLSLSYGCIWCDDQFVLSNH